ncbi:hypothetical protein GEMRC1_012577 [Eukaryota sp. GEM-RC1]
MNPLPNIHLDTDLSHHICFSRKFNLLCTCSSSGNLITHKISPTSTRLHCSFPVYLPKNALVVDISSTIDSFVILSSKSLHVYSFGLFPQSELRFSSIPHLKQLGQAKSLSSSHHFHSVLFSRGVGLFRDATSISLLQDSSISATLLQDNTLFLGKSNGTLMLWDTITWTRQSSYQVSTFPILALSSLSYTLAVVVDHSRDPTEPNILIFDSRNLSKSLAEFSYPYAEGVCISNNSIFVVRSDCSYSTINLQDKCISEPMTSPYLSKKIDWRQRVTDFDLYSGNFGIVDNSGIVQLFSNFDECLPEFPTVINPLKQEGQLHLDYVFDCDPIATSAPSHWPDDVFSPGPPIVSVELPRLQGQIADVISRSKNNRIIFDSFDNVVGKIDLKGFNLAGKSVLKFLQTHPAPTASSDSNKIPPKFRQHFKSFEHLEFNWSAFNSTAISSLETDQPLSEALLLVYLFYFNDKIRLRLDQHHCESSNCIACELSFVFESIDRNSKCFASSVASCFSHYRGNITCCRNFLNCVVNLNFPVLSDLFLNETPIGSILSFIVCFLLDQDQITDCYELFSADFTLILNQMSVPLNWFVSHFEQQFLKLGQSFLNGKKSFLIDFSSCKWRVHSMKVQIPLFLNFDKFGRLSAAETHLSNDIQLRAAIFSINSENIVGYFKISSRFSNFDHENDWLFVNEYRINTVNSEEVVKVLSWKLPVFLVYSCSSTTFVQSAPLIKDSCYVDVFERFSDPLSYSLNTLPHQVSQVVSFDFPRLFPIGVRQYPLIAIDCEYVELFQNFHSSFRPKLGVGRVSVVHVVDDEHFPTLIDDWTLVNEPVKDYVTRYSGLTAELLSPNLTTTYLTDFKNTFIKLKYFIDCGFTFVGHGIKKDFHILNIDVPVSQIFDTVELYRLEGKRSLSLKFLAMCLLGEKIQVSTHDSIIDAVISAKLFKKFQLLKANNELDSVLRWLYEIGEIIQWGRQGFSRDSVQKYVERGFFPHLLNKYSI